MPNKITELLGIKYPIIQGAMAQIGRHELAAAVSNAGGLGIISSGGMTAEELRQEIRDCKYLTDKPFAVNLLLKVKNIPELVDVIIEEGVKIVTTGAGTPKLLMPLFKEHGILVISVVPSVKLAQKMEELGVAAVVAEGMEAGGHIGETTTMSLVPQVAQAVSIPVIAAGGIANGAGLVAAFALGASGVQLGTAFLVAEECPVPLSYKEAILAADDRATAVTGRSIGMAVRSLRTPIIEKYLEAEQNGASPQELEALTKGSLQKAVKEGDLNTGTFMAGQISGLVTEIKPAKDIIEELVVDANQVLANIEIPTL